MFQRYIYLFLLLAGTIISPAHDFPKPFNTEPDTSATPIPAEKAAATFQLPPGCVASVFACEPDVQNPVAMTWDVRGRLWVAENYTYGKKGVRLEMSLRDRVLIFEDTDWDGKADKRTVFTDDVQVLTSIELGHGGTWLMCPPQLLYIPDKNQDDVPDENPTVVLDGFTVAQSNYHNFANGLRWGPDGWLYGRCGHSCPGDIGKPGTPKAERIPIKGGIWRYHPDTEIFEVLTHGTVNPWGHDWNGIGELFHINTVTGHLYHAIPGAHFRESYGESENPFVFNRLSQHADHFHYDKNGKWQLSRDGGANEFGGGHSHIGMCIYQADHFPKEWHGKLLTWNQHGRRLNRERLERHGAGFIARHEPDQFFSGDDWFRGIEISTGPDGALYGLDWSDTGECHEHTGVHRTSGRIYRFAMGAPDKPDFSILQESANRDDFDSLLKHPNAWFYRQWQQNLALIETVPPNLEKYLRGNLAKESGNNTELRLRALWALYQIGATKGHEWLQDPDEAVQSAAIKLTTDFSPIDTMESRVRANSDLPFEKLNQIADSNPSALVRLTLASTLQRLPTGNRATIAAALASHSSDVDDYNLPHMVWFGLIPLIKSNPDALIEIASSTQWPILQTWIARALGNQPKPLEKLLNLAAANPDKSRQILTGLEDAFRGVRKVQKPANWDQVAAKINHPKEVAALGVLFGDGKALDEVIATALDNQADSATRRMALETLIDAKPENLREICETLISKRELSSEAIRGLVLYDDIEVAKILLKNFRSNRPAAEKAKYINALTSRAEWAKLLLEQIDEGKLNREEISPFQARQILTLDNATLSAALRKTWGDLRQSDQNKAAKIAGMKQSLSAETLSRANLNAGRQHFQTVCAACHKLYGEGGSIGPDLTGSGRSDLDYLLENIIDPSAIVPADYRMTIVKTKDGRMISGVIKGENKQTVTLAIANTETTLEKSTIESRSVSPASLMPESLLLAFSAEQIRDLMAYLMHPSQVPLLENGR